MRLCANACPWAQFQSHFPQHEDCRRRDQTSRAPAQLRTERGGHSSEAPSSTATGSVASQSPAASRLASVRSPLAIARAMRVPVADARSSSRALASPRPWNPLDANVRNALDHPAGEHRPSVQ